MLESHKTTFDCKLVYIRDTHPVLGFRAPTNDRRDGKPEDEPKTLADREKWAATDCKKCPLKIPIVMDTMDDATLTAYDAWPQRIYVLRKDGSVAYRSSGLVGFLHEEVAAALAQVAQGK